MPGIATHFKIFELCKERLATEASSNPNIQSVINVLDNQLAYGYLGAIGASIGDYLPAKGVENPENQKSDENPYVELWRKVFGIMGNNLVNSDGPGLIRIFRELDEILEKVIQGAIAEEDPGVSKEDAEDLQSSLDELLETIDDEFMTELGTIIMADLDPNGTFGLKRKEQEAEEEESEDTEEEEPGISVADFDQQDAILPPEEWSIRQILFSKRTGQFAKALLQRAQESGDERNLAYAYGYLISFVSNAIGNAFINSIVGGPYRLNWWRTRYIQMFVDAWVYGYYEKNVNYVDTISDTVNPHYDDWPNLATARLHDKLTDVGLDPTLTPGEISEEEAVKFFEREGLPQDLMERVWNRTEFEEIIPESFVNFWITSFVDTYSDLPQKDQIDSNAINGAVQIIWLVLWFQTSGEAIKYLSGDILVDTGISKDFLKDCEGEQGMEEEESDFDESEVDPSAAEDPPEAEVEGGGDKKKRASGIALAILAVLSYIFGPAGSLARALTPIFAAIGGALIEEGLPDWPKLRCSSFKARVILNQGIRGFHDMLLVAGFVHPYSRQLGFEGDNIKYHAAPRTTKSTDKKDFPKGWHGTADIKKVIEDPDQSLGDGVENLAFWTHPPDGEILQIPKELIPPHLFEEVPILEALVDANGFLELPTLEEPLRTGYVAAAYPIHFIEGVEGGTSQFLVNPLVGSGILTEDDWPGPSKNMNGGFGNVLDNVVHLFNNLDQDIPNWNLDADRGLAHLTWKFGGVDSYNLFQAIGTSSNIVPDD